MKKIASILKFLTIDSAIAALALATSAPALAQDAEDQAPTEAVEVTTDTTAGETQQLSLAVCRAQETRDATRTCLIALKEQKEAEVEQLAQRQAQEDSRAEQLAQQEANVDENIQQLAQQEANVDENIQQLAQQEANVDENIQQLAQQEANVDENIQQLTQQEADADAEAAEIKTRINNVFLGDARPPSESN